MFYSRDPLDDYYILDGHTPKKVGVAEYIEWHSSIGNIWKRVNYTVIDDVTISTIFLSADHRWDNGPPILFETMVFGGPLDHEMSRYATWDEAEEGHNNMVKRVKEGMEQ